MRIGLIADTHGLLRPPVLDWLRGSDRLIHAGDVCDAGVLARLAEMAPLDAVRGNNDRGDWARALPEQQTLHLGGLRVHLLHDLKDLAIDPAAAGVHVVITGHSHRPSVQRRDGVLYVNPGSAGPRRFSLPVSAAELWIEGDRVRAELRHFEVAPPPSARRR